MTPIHPVGMRAGSLLVFVWLAGSPAGAQPPLASPPMSMSAPPAVCLPPPVRAAAAKPKPRPATAPAVLPRQAGGGTCYITVDPGRACMTGKKLCEKDMAIAQIAWKYFQNNYQPATGMVNAVDKYPSTTMWDTASVIAGTVAARDLGIINEKEFDDRMVALLSTLLQLKLFVGEAPNKAYDTRTAQMADYGNKPTADGIGMSGLDLARLASLLDVMGCMFPKHAISATRVLQSWSYCRLIQDGQINGAYWDGKAKKAVTVQEGRLGYEQYAGKTFAMLGFDQRVSSRYNNEYAQTIRIYGIPIAYDVRDPRKLGAYNYVVTESYALDAMEFGLDAENATLIRNIYTVQKRRWQETGIVTAVSEDNLDRPPYFVYNTIFAAGTPWNAITDQGVDQSAYRTVSTKAAFSLATLFPEDEYSAVLLDKIASAYDPERGWYSGVFESGLGYNKAITANTNGIILQALLYKAHGPLHAKCSRCRRGLKLNETDNLAQARSRCFPGKACNTCTAAR